MSKKRDIFRLIDMDCVSPTAADAIKAYIEELIQRAQPKQNKVEKKPKKVEPTGRERFVYENGYGKTTDMWLLPVGTKFHVTNGHWEGAIIEEGGKRYMLIGSTKKEDALRKVEIKEDTDCNLVIDIFEEDAFGNKRYLR